MDKTRAGMQSVQVGYALLETRTRAHGALMLRDLTRAAGMRAAKAHRYPVSHVDAAWTGKVATAVGQAARQLSRELGHAD